MDYFPLFIKTKDRKVLMVGGGEESGHKLRLMLKTSAALHVFGAITDDAIAQWRDEGRLRHHDRPLRFDDTSGAAFAYIGVDDPKVRDAAMALCDAAGLPYCVIDDKARSHFITPALVDRDPVVVAIGSEGTGPVMARGIKSRIDAMLPQGTGAVARAAGAFRPHAEVLPKGAARRQFWARYSDDIAPGVLARQGASAPQDELHDALTAALHELLTRTRNGDAPARPGHSARNSGGSFLPVVVAHDADLLTRQAAQLLHEADVVLHDRGASPAVLELTRREARRIEITGDHDVISAAVLTHLNAGDALVYLTASASPRLDDAVLTMAGVELDILPHVTSGVAAGLAAGGDDAHANDAPDNHAPGLVFLPRHSAQSTRFLRKI